MMLADDNMSVDDAWTTAMVNGFATLNRSSSYLIESTGGAGRLNAHRPPFYAFPLRLAASWNSGCGAPFRKTSCCMELMPPW
jgi:hypothetical protein